MNFVKWTLTLCEFHHHRSEKRQINTGKMQRKCVKLRERILK